MLNKFTIFGFASLLTLSANATDQLNVDASKDMMDSSMHAMHKMHVMEVTGDTDKDFIMGMIPHHEGAVVMSEKIIPHLTDPEIRKFAENIVKAQKEEIEFMNDWLEKNRPES